MKNMQKAEPDRQVRGGSVEPLAQEDIAEPHSYHPSLCIPSATQRPTHNR